SSPSAASRTARDRRGVGNLRHRAASSHLPFDSEGARAARRGAVAVGALLRSHRRPGGAAEPGGGMSLRGWLPWRRERQREEFADEMRAPLEMAALDRIRGGESAGQAAVRARREFGNAGLAQEIARDQWGGTAMWLERLEQDVRHALRGLRRA